jgi:gentisate 1,2-dioxygenase
MSSIITKVRPADTPDTRARFHDPENFFAFHWPAVPRQQFLDERDEAFATGTVTSEILLDMSEVLGTTYPATTPLLLARYLRVRSGEKIDITRRASAEVIYVLRGCGHSTGFGETIDWVIGDALCFPGGDNIVHSASADAVLFCVCNEPLLIFEDLEPPRGGHARVLPTHWRKSAIDVQFETILNRPDSEQTTGHALQLATAVMAPATHTIPSMNAAINTLEPGGDQRPHRHNGAAITLAIEGAGTYSMIENERIDWSTGAAQITPATELHSHHNRGGLRMESLVVQDEGLHFYTRTPGFSWD